MGPSRFLHDLFNKCTAQCISGRNRTKKTIRTQLFSPCRENRSYCDGHFSYPSQLGCLHIPSTHFGSTYERCPNTQHSFQHHRNPIRSRSVCRKASFESPNEVCRIVPIGPLEQVHYSTVRVCVYCGNSPVGIRWIGGAALLFPWGFSFFENKKGPTLSGRANFVFEDHSSVDSSVLSASDSSADFGSR